MFKSLIPWRRHPEKEAISAEPIHPEGGSLMHMFDSLFDRLQSGFGMTENPDRWHLGWECDMKDSDDEIVVRAEAPGFEPDEIQIKMSGNQLVLEAEHREDPKGNGNRLHYGKYYRSMTMPRGIQQEGITAEYKNGILEVHLPKGAEAHARRIPVKPK